MWDYYQIMSVTTHIMSYSLLNIIFFIFNNKEFLWQWRYFFTISRDCDLIIELIFQLFDITNSNYRALWFIHTYIILANNIIENLVQGLKHTILIYDKKKKSISKNNNFFPKLIILLRKRFGMNYEVRYITFFHIFLAFSLKVKFPKRIILLSERFGMKVSVGHEIYFFFFPSCFLLPLMKLNSLKYWYWENIEDELLSHGLVM